MPYLLRSGDTIMDVAFNTSGSITAIDQLIEQNTSEEYTMLGYNQVLSSAKFFQGSGHYYVFGGKYTLDNVVAGDKSYTVEAYFTAPDYINQSSSMGVFNGSGGPEWARVDVSFRGVLVAYFGGTFGDIPFKFGQKFHMVFAFNAETKIASLTVNGGEIYREHEASNILMRYLSLGEYGDRTPNYFNGSIIFYRAFDFIVDPAILWNNGNPNTGHMAPIEGRPDNTRMISEYIPANLSPTIWKDSSGFRTRHLPLIGDIAPHLVLADTPETNQFETYTPVLEMGQVLNTDNIPIYNLEAVQGDMYNSTILEKTEVEAEILTLVNKI